MSVLRHADEKPIPDRGWLAVLLYAAVVFAISFSWKACVRPTRAAAAEPAQEQAAETLATGRVFKVFCSSVGGEQLTPNYAQQGDGAEVTCRAAGGRVRKVVRFRCAEQRAQAQLAGFGTDPTKGLFFRVSCTAGGGP